jgi:limonene-1,2-epoxide hydrolase
MRTDYHALLQGTLMTHTLSRRAVLTLSGSAALAGLLPPDDSAAAQRSDAGAANVALVNRFCAAWAIRDITAPLAFLAPDVSYRMTETTPAVTGHDGVISRLKAFVDAAERIEFEVLGTYAVGPMVVNHRIDRFVSTTRPLVWEGVGVFLVKDGLIKEWHDYTIRITR